MLLLLMVYVITIQRIKPNIVFYQNQYQSNVIFAQNFLYAEVKPSQVIVGSSMATRMKFEKSEDVYNLAFGGGAPLTGLEIIRQSGFVPKVIFIESNVFTMMSNEVFLEKLFTPVLFELRGQIIAFQEKYQVLNIVGNFIYSFAGRSQEEKLQQKIDKKLLDKLVNSALKKADTFKIKDREVLLKKWHMNIDYFKQKGTKLIFFEMPNDSRLVKTEKRKKLRSLIKNEFPNILYIEENNLDDRYKTGDGIHLTLKSAMDFTEYFKTNLGLDGWVVLHCDIRLYSL